jgi:hypothetical protein
MTARYPCRFEIDDKMIQPAEVARGLVVTNGPKATLYIWNEEDLKYDQVDRLEKVTRGEETDDGDFTIIGVSDYLRSLGHPPKAARTTVHVTPKKGCKTCG